MSASREHFFRALGPAKMHWAIRLRLLLLVRGTFSNPDDLAHMVAVLEELGVPM